MGDRLESIMASPAWRSARRGGGRPGPLVTDWVSRAVRSGPVPAGDPASLRGPASGRRRGLLRALKPLTVHERLIDGELLNAIEKLDANLRSSAIRDQAAMRRRIEELEGEQSEAQRRDPG